MALNASEYHLKTSYDRHQMGGHALDWHNQPDVFKTYPHAEPLPLPRDLPLPHATLCDVLSKESPPGPTNRTMTKEDTARVLLMTYTLTARARHGDGTFYFRSAASAGALFPTELYVASEGVKGLDDGLYHFSIMHHGLTPLRQGTPSPHILRLSETGDGRAPVLTFFLSAIFFRSAWKYRDRAYRYHLLDTGHVLEHLMLALRVLDRPATLTYDFDDAETNRFLGLDETKEVCLAMVEVPSTPAVPGEAPERFQDLPHRLREASRVSAVEVDYPLIREAHGTGYRIHPEPEQAGPMLENLGVGPEAWAEIPAPPDPAQELDLVSSLFQRRSKRNFIPQPVTKEQMAAVLECLLARDAGETGSLPDLQRHTAVGFLLERVQGFSPGFHVLDPVAAGTGLVKPGNLLAHMTHICLDQAWLQNAAIHVLFMADTGVLDRLWGPRGYRYAMLSAGRLGERLYLTATSLGMGCCGIGAFYDREAATLLGLGRTATLLYLVALGPVKGSGTP